MSAFFIAHTEYSFPRSGNGGGGGGAVSKQTNPAILFQALELNTKENIGHQRLDRNAV